MKGLKPALVICIFQLSAALLLFSGNMCPNFAAGITTIDLVKNAETPGGIILLGEIAKIYGDDTALAEKLNLIQIGKAPLPGKTRRIDEKYIRLRLKQNGVDMHRTILHVPEYVEIKRSCVRISKEEIKKIAASYVHRKILHKYGNARIKNVRVGHDLILPKGKISYQVVNPGDGDISAIIYLYLVFKVDGRYEKKIRVQADIEVFTNVVVTKPPLARYQQITRNDVVLRRMDVCKLSSNIITDLEYVLGKRAKRRINSKTVLRTDLIEIPPVVKRGDLVSIIAESDGLKLITLGKVLKKGYKGELLRVMSLDSGKKIYARVIDSHTVKVNF